MSPVEIGLMHERRSPEVQELIDDRFANLQVTFPNYSRWGISNAYTFKPCISTTRLITELRERRGDQPLRVLDVGAGAGSLVVSGVADRQEQDVVHGVSAYDFRQDVTLATLTRLATVGDAYKVGDAETLDAIPGLLPEYDLVVSRWTIRHLLDKVGAFEQMANRVAVGGILAVDNFHWDSLDLSHRTSCQTVYQALARAGFDLSAPYQLGIQSILATTNGSFVPDLVLPRDATSEPVRIPFNPVLSANAKSVQYTPLD